MYQAISDKPSISADQIFLLKKTLDEKQNLLFKEFDINRNGIIIKYLERLLKNPKRLISSEIRQIVNLRQSRIKYGHDATSI